MADSCVRGLNPAQRELAAARTRKWAFLFGSRFLGRTGQKKTLEKFPKGCHAGSACSDWLKSKHEKALIFLSDMHLLTVKMGVFFVFRR